MNKEIDLTHSTLTADPYLTFTSFPKYVGGYQLGGSTGLRINFTQKPKWFHRKMMKLCLGWEWINN
jgi:hypothetical protein